MPTKRSYTDHGDACSTAHAMELLGDRWTYPILREVMLGPKRFGELADGARGITPAVLTSRLRELEHAGLIGRATSPSGPVTTYAITDWGRDLQPIFNALGRWAQASQTWAPDGCGLTPDATVQSMLTMAPSARLTPPVELTLTLSDERHSSMHAYDFRLRWARGLTIERGQARRPQAQVYGDSSTWTRVLYEGEPLSSMQVDGDAEAVRRVVEQFAAG